MEFFPGAFEREWERRRAMLMHEKQLGQTEKSDWDEPRRGGVARIADEGLGGFNRARQRQGGSGVRWLRGGAAAGRSMRTRFGALARGSQPAVVKLASYGGGARAGAMMSYTSRGGELAVENERGERLLGKDALAEQRAEWEHLFDNRAASRDMAVFHVSVNTASLRDDVDQDDQLREILRAGYGDRRFVYAARERSSGELYVSGVVVLRDGSGERLTGDQKAAGIVQQRFDDSDAGRDIEARFRFHGYGNGVEWGTARIRELVADAEGEVRDDTGKLIGDATHAGDLVQKEWRKELHSRKGRDVMHLIVSARAGTDGAAFEAAVREFLGEQFAARRVTPGDDLFSSLLRGTLDGEPLTEHDLRGYGVNYLLGGTETTRNLIGQAMRVLLEHPDQLARFTRGEVATSTLVDELLRYITPVLHHSRWVTKDVDVDGVSLRAGDRVTLWMASANRDEAVFDAPEALDIGRSPNHHVALGGGGPHFCLGSHLAKLEAVATLDALRPVLERCSFAGEPRRVRSNFINGMKALPIAVA